MTQLYAHVVDGVVIEIVTPIEGFALADCFAPEVVAECVACGADVAQGWTYDAATATFAPPAPPARPLADVQAEKIAALSAACAATIVGGCTSSALGAPHVYPTDPANQMNMTASVVDSLLAHEAGWTTPFKCADAAGAWALREHTAAQIQQAGSELKAMIVAALRKFDALSAQVGAATANATVDAISW